MPPDTSLEEAATSLNEARQAYEGSQNRGTRKTRIAALDKWNDAAKTYFSKAADEFLSKNKASPHSSNPSYAETVLKDLADHYLTVREAARQLGIDPTGLIPPFIKFSKLQACLRDTDPKIASALRNRFIEVGLPTYGFDRTSPQGLEWKWFVVGCALLIFAFILALWGFSLGKLTEDQRRILVWSLALASGFAAAAFAGSFNAKARDWIPGLAITATGGFGVWLITFFFLFPESKVDKPIPADQSPSPNKTPTATPQAPREAAAVFAGEFLALLDAGNYANAYERLTDYLKNQANQVGFEQGIKQNRDWRGKLLERKVLNISAMQNPPGASPGQYSRIVYQSNFEKSSQTTEDVVVVLIDDNTWKVFQYYIAPPNGSPSLGTNANQTASSRDQSIPDLGYTKMENFQGGVEAGAIWRFTAGISERVCERPVFLQPHEKSVSNRFSMFFSREQLSSDKAVDILGAHFAKALVLAGAETVEVELGFTVTQDLPEEVFADERFASQWSPFYRHEYELAKAEEDNLVVISSVLVSRGDQFRVTGSTMLRLKDVAEMLHEERNTNYNLGEEADGSILIAASETRSVAVAYRGLKPSRMPPLAVASGLTLTSGPTPATEPTPAAAQKREYLLAWFNPLQPNILFKVVTPDQTNGDLNGSGGPIEVFKRWCTPLDLSNKTIVQQIAVAGDERFLGGEPNWWTKPPYNLPELNSRWPEIMDDTRWYMLELEDKQAGLPVFVATVSPSPSITVPPKPTFYKLIWSEPDPALGRGLFEVIHTDASIGEVYPKLFRRWCKPFSENDYKVLKKVLVAAHEHFQTEPNYWINPPYNLPQLRERWFQIMDDEEWYVYTLQDK